MQTEKTSLLNQKEEITSVTVTEKEGLLNLVDQQKNDNINWWIDFVRAHAVIAQVLAGGSAAVGALYFAQTMGLNFDPTVFNAEFFAGSAILATVGIAVFKPIGTVVGLISNRFSPEPKTLQEILKYNAKFTVNGLAAFFANTPLTALAKKGASAIIEKSPNNNAAKIALEILAPILAGGLTTAVLAGFSHLKLGKLDLKIKLPKDSYAQLFLVYTLFGADIISNAIADFIISQHPEQYQTDHDKAMLKQFMPVIVAAMGAELINLRFAPSAAVATVKTVSGWAKTGADKLSTCWNSCSLFKRADDANKGLTEDKAPHYGSINSSDNVPANQPKLQQP